MKSIRKSRKMSSLKSRKRSRDIHKSLRKSRKMSSRNIHKSLRKSRRRRKQSVKKIKMNFGITKENWLVYSKKGCPYCQDAKNILLERKTVKDNVQVKIIDKDTLSKPLVVYKDGKIYDKWPRIFLNGEFIGGFGDLKNKFYS